MKLESVPRRLVFSGRRPEVEWIATDGSPYHEPFFEQTLWRLGRLPANAGPELPRTPVEALANAGDAAPTAFIFHVSRCGSTLVCRLAAALGDIVISEAPVLDDILRAHQREPWVTDADREAWFRGAVASLCGRAKEQGRRAFVKLDGWHVFELDVVRRAFPHVPFVFVYRNPVAVVVSLMRMPSVALIRGTLTPGQMGMRESERDALGREDFAAAIIGAYYREAVAHGPGLLPLAYEDLPGAVWRTLPGGPFSTDEVAKMSDAATRDAKQPAQAFTPDAEAKRRAATPAVVAACERWANEGYERWLETVRQRRTDG